MITFNALNDLSMEVKTYSSPYALKEAFDRNLKEWLLPFERTDVNQPFFLPDRDTFEVVDFGSGGLRLFPAEYHYPFFFRGQGQEYYPCLPSIYRHTSEGRSPDDVDIFVDRMRITEFGHLLDSHPVVNGFFRPHKFYVDYTGLAQHYGLRTDMLDITSDLDVAMFFAMCPYDKEADRYRFVDDGEEHVGIIYLLMPFFNDFDPDHPFTKISPIGLQVFDRPGRQKGFGYKMRRGESLYARKYQFRYTSADSAAFYQRYLDGEHLWCRDILADKASLIARKRSFPYSVFKQTFREHPVKGFSKSRLKDAMKEKGIVIDHRGVSLSFSDEEKDFLVGDWYAGKSDRFRKLITRKRWVLSREGDGGSHATGTWHDCRTVEMLWTEHALRLMMSADAVCPDGGVLVGQAPEKGRRYSSGTRKVDAQFIDMKATEFLSASDMCLMP